MKVASGEPMKTKGKCQQLRVLIQGVELYIDFFVLETNDYDAALGTQLFKMLGLILWDFNSLKNTLLVERTGHCFQGN